MEITNVQLGRLKVPLLKGLKNEEIYGRKLLNTIEYPRLMDGALEHYSCVC